MNTCPICNYTGLFKEYGTIPRSNALCPNCNSLERKRLLYFILVNELNILKNTNKVLLHFAPSKGMYNFFIQSNFVYLPKDFNPMFYEKYGLCVDEFNMCVDFNNIRSNSIDIVLSTHVLEHPKCSYETILNEINRILVPGGIHIISAAMKGDYTREDYTMSEEERSKEFGGKDHWRIFGHKDFPLILESVFGNVYRSDMFNQLSAEDIEKYSISDTSFFISYKE